MNKIAVYAHTLDGTYVYDGGIDGFFWFAAPSDGRVIYKVTYIDHTTSSTIDSPRFFSVSNSGMVFTPANEVLVAFNSPNELTGNSNQWDHYYEARLRIAKFTASYSGLEIMR